MIVRWIKNKIVSILEKHGYEIRKNVPASPVNCSRFEYQSRFIEFDIPKDGRVLDIGSGAEPFPHATILVDRYPDKTEHRTEKLVTNGKPLVIADVHELPFREESFDFVYCVHLLEHVEDPVKACGELMRVGRRGYIETPNFGKDMLFAWGDNVHKWHVVAIAGNLCFFEYSEREKEGIRSSAWRSIIRSKHYHPLQDVFYNNQDIFNSMFLWSDSFNVFVFKLDGTVESHDKGNQGA